MSSLPALQTQKKPIYRLAVPVLPTTAALISILVLASTGFLSIRISITTTGFISVFLSAPLLRPKSARLC